MKENPRPEYSVGTKAVHAAAYLVEQQAKRAEHAEAEVQRLQMRVAELERVLAEMFPEWRRFIDWQMDGDLHAELRDAALKVLAEGGYAMLEAHPWLKGE